MNKSRISLIFVISLILLSSMALPLFAVQTYTQTVARDGTSKIERSTDVFKSIFKEGGLERMAKTCQEKPPNLDCSVTDTIVDIKTTLPNSGHYTYTVDYGLIFITHKLVIYYIPTDKFGEDMERLVTLSNASQNDFRTRSIDLRADNSAFSKSDLPQPYIIKMPAGVASATAGNTTAKIDGNIAEFDLTKVYAESKPMTIIAQELNWSYLIIILAVLIFVGMTYMFFKRPSSKTDAYKEYK